MRLTQEHFSQAKSLTKDLIQESIGVVPEQVLTSIPTLEVVLAKIIAQKGDITDIREELLAYARDFISTRN